VFDEKAKHYASEAKNRADRAVIAWDWNKDGTLEDDEKTSLQSVVMER
jgi:hypothetical protein